MRKLAITIEEHNALAVARELEHIAQIIMQGYTVGAGWSLLGDDEAEPKIEVEELEEEPALE